MKFLIIIFSLTLSFHAEAKLASLCTRALEEIHKNDLTANFISYLSYLSESGFLKDTDLENILIESQKQSQIVLPFLQSASSSELDIHVDPLKEYLAANPNTQRFLDWLKQKVAQAQVTQKEKSETSKETASANLRINLFHRLEIKKEQPEYENLTNIVKSWRAPKIPHTFEAMPTMVTAAMWMEIMGKPVKKRQTFGDEPVVGITWWSAAEFANRLSRRKGLPEVYNFSHLTFDPNTSAEDGNWTCLTLDLPRINHPSQDIYQALGYRLPTVHEQFFILGNGEDMLQNMYPPGVNVKNILEHEWFDENSKRTIQPVATRKPYMVQGHAFYDLLSNAQELSSNFALINDDKKLLANVNRLGHSYSTHRSWIENGHLYKATLEMQFGDTGFRLVRSLPK